jgi:signal transduction histidine kinase
MAEKLHKLSPEMLIPRLGEYLVQKGWLSERDLQKALAFQTEQRAGGNQILLGQALTELNLIGRDVLDQAITEQFLQLREALQASNRNLEQRVRDRTVELKEALERLSELNRMKANFVANISHELRTPLTHAKGYIDLLVTESFGKVSKDQRDALDVIQRSFEKLEGLIEDLIMFSLATRGEMSMKLDRVDIHQLAASAVKSARPKAEARGVTVELTAAENLPAVQADPQKIGWVINQLIGNGIKFTPSGGKVLVKLGEEADNLVMVSVADTGIGIPAGRKQEIFEPFHQLDGSSTRHYGGTGLGLSLVREIVEAHGSLLEVQSEEGRGSVFKFPLLALRE